MTRDFGEWAAPGLESPMTLGGTDIEIVKLTADGTVERGICICLMDTDGWPNQPEWIADVRIIRLLLAAPKLLEGCRRALQFIENGVAFGYIDPLTSEPEKSTPGFLRAAILATEPTGREGGVR